MKRIKILLLFAVLTVISASNLWAGTPIETDYVEDPAITAMIASNPAILESKLKAAMLKEIENPESINIEIEHISPQETALGRFKKIKVTAARSTTQDIVVDKAVIEFLDVALNTKKLIENEKIRVVKKCTINLDVVVKEEDLNKLLAIKAKKNKLENPKIKLNEGNIELSGATRYSIVKIEFWGKGNFSIKDDKEIWFHASKLKVNRVAMPRNFIGTIVKKINPILDFSKFAFNVNVESIKITKGQIRISSYPD